MNATTPDHLGITPPTVRQRADAPVLDTVSTRSIDKAVSWRAVIAGSAGAAALSLILLVLGTGLGLASVSPWSQAGIAATTFGVSTVIWITFTQLAASGLGGYLAGRLRTRWDSASNDERYFRDTAHGFLAWAVATLATAALLTSAIGSMLGTGVQAAGAGIAGAAGVTAAVAKDADAQTPLPYFANALFRVPAGATPGAPVTPETVAEVSGIYLHNGRAATLPADDLRYVSQRVAQHTGVTPQDAQSLVTASYSQYQVALQNAEAQAKAIADKARKATAYGSLWLFVSLLAGAFIASFAATFGGRQRDADAQFNTYQF
jgi:hypothetical protein